MLFDKYAPDRVMNVQFLDNFFSLQLLSFAITKEALHEFAIGSFEKFDPNVGDYSCQIRAVILTDLAGSQIPFRSIINQIQQREETLKQLVHKLRNRKFRKTVLKNKITVADFLAKEGIDFSLSADIKTIVISYFLSKYRAVQAGFDVRRFMADSGLNLTFTHELIRSCQRYLENASIEYVQQKARCLQFAPFSLCQKRLKELEKGIEQVDGGCGRRSVACFFGFKVLLNHIVQTKRLIALKVNTFCAEGKHLSLLLYVVKDGHLQLQNEPDPSLASLPAIVIEGNQFEGSFEEFKAKEALSKRCQTECHSFKSMMDDLQNMPIEEVILANAAAHPQFAGDEEGRNKEIDFAQLPALEKEFRLMHHQAIARGTCYANMKTLLIKHIYPAKVSTLFKATALRSATLEERISSQNYFNNPKSIELSHSMSSSRDA